MNKILYISIKYVKKNKIKKMRILKDIINGYHIIYYNYLSFKTLFNNRH